MRSTGWWLGAWLAVAGLGCGGATVRTDDDGVARVLGGPVARGLATAAPEAWLEVMREADRVRGLTGVERADAEMELTLSLEWAQAVAERGASDRSLAAASTQRAQLAEEQARLDAEVTRLEQSARASLAAHAQAQQAQRAARAPTAVEQARRGAVAGELDQQTELLLAAAELFGARPEALAPLRARLAAPAVGPADPVARAAAIYRDADALLAATRASGTAVSTADVDALRLQSSLAESDGVDAHRDARGVVAVLRGLFAGPRLAPTARSRVELLARVIRSHGNLPVRVECFVAGVPAPALATARAQAAALRAALVTAGVAAERLQAAGYRRLQGGARPDDRVEVVLLSPRAE